MACWFLDWAAEGCRVRNRYPVSTLRSVGIPGRNANKHPPPSRLRTKQNLAKDRSGRWHPRRVRKQRMSTDVFKSTVRAGAGAWGSS